MNILEVIDKMSQLKTRETKIMDLQQQVKKLHFNLKLNVNNGTFMGEKG